MARDKRVIERARAAIVAHDYPAARDALIEAWRGHRSPLLAELVEIVADKAPDALTEKLATLVTPRVATTHENLRALREIDDPRLSRWAIDALVQLPFTAETAAPFLLDLIETAERHEDIRLVQRAGEIETAVKTRINRLAVRTKLCRRVRDAEIDTPAEPSPAELELRSLLEPLRKTTRSIEALLADIYANPADDAPRLVLADLLLERGDPRGEFIMLQLERKDVPTERERQLLKKHGKAWMGALAPVLSWGRGYARTEFRRGFVAKADIILSVGKKLDPIRSDPAWSTVEELDGSWDWELLETAPLHGLRELERPVSVEVLPKLVGRSFPLLTTIRVMRVDFDPQLLHGVFPALERVLVFQRSDVAKDLAAFGRLAVPCVRVTNYWVERDLAAAEREFDAYVEELIGKPAPLARLELEGPQLRSARSPATVVLVRGNDGKFSRQ